MYQLILKDCPNGDDERHCIALAHHLDSTEEMSYSNSGILFYFILPIYISKDCRRETTF